MKTTITPTKEHASKIVELLSHGLVCGLGTQKPGEMCVEAAVNCALGLPHGDNPPCVGSAVRAFKIALNDSSWSSTKARADGMRKLAIAQLGSDTLDQREFSRLLALRTTQKLLPGAIRDYAKYCKPQYVEEMKTIAAACEAAQSNEEMDDSLDSLARLDSLDRLDSLASLARLASLASLARLDSLASLARLARLDRLASLDSLDRLDRLDNFLSTVAEVGLGVLIEMKSPGCEWLNLCE